MIVSGPASIWPDHAATNPPAARGDVDLWQTDGALRDAVAWAGGGRAGYGDNAGAGHSVTDLR